MIKTIKLKYGRSPSSAPAVIDTTPVTVFVGPNNSGKTKVLSEIAKFCREGQSARDFVIVDDIDFQPISEDGAKQIIDILTLQPRQREAVREDDIIIGKRGTRQLVKRNELVTTLQNPNRSKILYCKSYLGLNTIMLNGTTRIGLVGEQDGGDLQEPPTNSLQVLLRDDEKRLEIRRILYDAFSLYFVIDPTKLGKLRIRLSSRKPTDVMEELGIHKEAVQFHASADPITETSDGVKAFTGLITEIVAGDPQIMLVDEPEAFLHPSLANNLGKEIAQISIGIEKRLFVSTHSPDFVMGCIQSGSPMNIVRLTYRGGVATARVLPNDAILRLMRDPLLRSTGVLSGLFYDYVIVTEGDADRAFYQEINERLLRYTPELGIPNCLFLNAQNKQTVPTILKPLREMGIPAAGIVDIDVLKDGGAVWSNFLAGGSLPDITRQELSTSRSLIKNKLEEARSNAGKDMKRDGGVDILEIGDKESANNLFDKLDSYGLFVVRKGELEVWLNQLAASGHGPQWLIEVFEKMGENPESPGYLKPSDDDVWRFMGDIRHWLCDPNRKGIPE